MVLKIHRRIWFDTATKLNLTVVKSIGKTEIKRLLAQTDYAEIKNLEDSIAIIEIAADLYFPGEHKYKIKVLDRNSLGARLGMLCS